MKNLQIMVAVVAAVLLAVAWTASASDKPTGCTVKITGGVEQSFSCQAELRKPNAWVLIIGNTPSQPTDLGGLITFEGEPQIGKVYEMKDVEDVTQSVRDKHDKEGNSWSASAAKKPSKFGPQKLQPPVGSMTLKFTAVGPEPTAHGTLTVNLKPDTFNKNKKDVVMSFEF